MAAGRMLTSHGFSSTPLKSCNGSHRPVSGLEDCILSEDEDTFSLLSPIYHDSFDSDKEHDRSRAHHLDLTSPRERSTSGPSNSPVRCELSRTLSDLEMNASEQPGFPLTLTAWEMWLVNKAKEEQLRLERKAEEERQLKEKEEQQEREQEQKKIATEEKIQQWLLMKREQEKQEQLVRESKEVEEMERQQMKRRETEQKSREKYRGWLQRKNQEKIEKEKKEKEDTFRKTEQEKERRKKSEENFKEWLARTNEKDRASPPSQCHNNARSPYEKLFPSPHFYNPVPWKPIPVPPPEKPEKETPIRRKPQEQRKRQQNSIAAVRQRTSVTAARHQRR
ncbi:coiled-coil domain-containing protein 34 [Genypterus blacodes]|uniref:coiled-coil domain-containing protein 34 n=1 Tax=Genypterus blacodes TaxID=154954 RepID=UPI003F75BFB5